MEKLTKALMTDETGQAIVTKLTALSKQMHELAIATRGSAILFESESDISVLGDGGYLAVYVGSTNPLVISGWTGDNSLVTGHLYYLIKSGTDITSSDLGKYGGTAVTDTTLELSKVAADAKAVGDTIGDLKDDLNRAIEDFAIPTQEAVDNWLEAHPEATTTVQDGAITEAKLANDAVAIEKIDENARILINGYGTKKEISALRNWAQDSSVFNGKIFGVGTGTGVLKIYDIPSGELLATSSLSGDIKPHGNAVSFGNKQNSDDTYPLLYVTGYNGLDGDGNELPRGTCFVYKINDDYSTELVQSIYVDFVDTSLWLGAETPNGVIRWGNYIVDADNNFLYVFTLLNENYVSKTRLFKFNIPSLNNNTVRLLESDIVEYHDLPFYPSLQGAEYYDDKLYISSDNALAIVDLNNYTQIGYITLTDIMTEPEAVIQFDGDIYVGNRQFYKLSSIPIDTNVGDLAKLKTFNNKTIVDAINSMNELYDFTQLVTNKTDLYNGKFIRKGNIATIIYQGESTVHEHQQVLFTLPVGYRPNSYEYIPAVKGGSAMIVRINGATGEADIWVDPSTLTTNARIYFSHSYICDQ